VYLAKKYCHTFECRKEVSEMFLLNQLIKKKKKEWQFEAFEILFSSTASFFMAFPG